MSSANGNTDTVSSGTVTYAVSFNLHDRSARTIDLKDIERELSDPDVLSWIDIQSPDIDLLNEVLSRLGIDLVLLSHFDEPEILPHIIEHPDTLSFYLYEIANPRQHLDTTQGLSAMHIHRLLLIIGNTFVLTCHRSELEGINYVKDTCADSFRLWGRSQGFIMFLLLQRCLYDYANLNLASDNYLDLLEKQSITGTAEKLAQDISVAAGNILTLKKMTANLHIILMMLGIKRSVFVSEEARHFYQEMNQNVASVRAAINASHDLLDGILSMMQAEGTQRTGDIARTLTIVSTIILPLSLIAGIYGMNFHHMPELSDPRGYFFVLSGMAILALVLVGTFWRLGWFSGKSYFSKIKERRRDGSEKTR